MNLLFNRSIKAICLAAVVALLSACGSGKTNDPFTPVRVIGLGDAHNDMSAGQYTVRGTGDVSTVVGQVAVYFGNGATAQSSVTTGDSTVADLNRQVNALGSLQSSDLIVITAGAAEYAGAGAVQARAQTFLSGLTSALDTLKSKGAKHILIMSLVDSSTPANADPDVVSFNSWISSNLGGYADVARFTNIDRPSAAFPNWATNTNTPYCGVGTTGCSVAAGRDAALYFLADSVNPTPAGNRWIAQYLYNNTAQGWR
jgi:phospholipase/lecithinase/hemolysin